MQKQNSNKAKNRIRFFKVFLGRKTVVVCLAVLILILIAAIFAPFLSPYDPNENDLINALQGVSWEHPLGTDTLGRDVLTRIMYGARVSYSVGVIAVLMACVTGMILGTVAGVVGGIVDSIIMRFIDAMMSIPMIIMALFLGSILGKGLFNIMVAVSVAMVPGFARVTRGQVLTLRESDYVTAGEICGASRLRNAVTHIIPNCLSPAIVLMTMNLGAAILGEASLSYLGMGINPPTASWGSMVSDGYNYLSMNPVIAIAPGVAIMVVVLCFNIVGDALRDALDPKLRGALK